MSTSLEADEGPGLTGTSVVGHAPDAAATDAAPSLDEAIEAVGVRDLHPAQREAVEALVGGCDVLAVIPTGGGKSAIYQIVGAVLPGPSVVVGPLLALHADQHDSIERSDLPAAAALDGSTPATERAEIVAALSEGTLEYLLVTPETLAADDLLDELVDAGTSLLVVDEAHCIATLGQGFRPDFLALGDVRRRLGSPTTVALTGSADPQLRDEIVALLQLDDPAVVVADLDRPNIDLELHSAGDRESARAGLVSDVLAEGGKTLVYAPTRRLCEDLAAELASGGRAAVAYHAGLSAADKAAALDHIRDDPSAVVVATTAFGMGIDIPDIAVVAHLDLPESLIAYYQEVGRAGRDGSPARGVAFSTARERSRRDFAGGVRTIEVQDCHRVAQAVGAQATSRRAVIDRTGLGAGRVTRALHVLADLGAVQLRPSIRRGRRHPDDEAIEQACRRREERDRSQVAAMARYRSVRRCRWSQILGSLGQALDRCGHCDVCAEDADGPGDDDGELTGVRVVHPEFGEGLVTASSERRLTVAFDEVGTKDLDPDLSWETGLLRLVVDEPS